MAKKFVEVGGLHRVFASMDDAIRLDAQGNADPVIVSDASALVDKNSILFITCDSSDAAIFGNEFSVGTNWIWGQGQFFGDKSAESIVRGYGDASVNYEEGILASDTILEAIKKMELAIATKAPVDNYLTGIYGIGDGSWISVKPSTDASKGPKLDITHEGPSANVANIGADIPTTITSDDSVIKTTYVGLDAKGHVINASSSTRNITLPSTVFSDEKVKDSSNNSTTVLLLGKDSTTDSSTAVTHYKITMFNGGVYAQKLVGSLDIENLNGDIDVSNNISSVPISKLKNNSFTIAGSVVELGKGYKKGAVAENDSSLVTGGDVSTYLYGVRDNLITSIVPGIEFKGTVTALPDSSLEQGNMYKAVGDFTIPASLNAEDSTKSVSVVSGDVIVYDGAKWVYIPTADESELGDNTDMVLRDGISTSNGARIAVVSESSDTSILLVGDSDGLVNVFKADNDIIYVSHKQFKTQETRHTTPVEYAPQDGSILFGLIGTDGGGVPGAHTSRIQYGKMPANYTHPISFTAATTPTPTDGGTISYGDSVGILIKADDYSHLTELTTKEFPSEVEDLKVTNIATTSSDSYYLLGQSTVGDDHDKYVGEAQTNSAVYMKSGSVYATSLYKGTLSIHDSDENEWADIP